MKYTAKRILVTNVNDSVGHEVEFHTCALDLEEVVGIHQSGQRFIEPSDRIVKRTFDPEATSACMRQVGGYDTVCRPSCCGLPRLR
jgi:hypothetical protein